MTCPIGTDVSRAAGILKAGGLVAFATETVYGLGGNAFDLRAVARIFEVKDRPKFDPLIVHVADVAWLEKLAADIPSAARKLADRFWPGPLTLVLPKTDAVPDLVTAGLATVAIRIPDCQLALELLRATNLPIAAPSANPFGQLSPTSADHVARQLGDKIDYILDGGECSIGLESTVLALTGDTPQLLRPGGLPVEEIEASIGSVTIPGRTEPTGSEAQPSPGMLSKHYAPQTPLVIDPTPSPPPPGTRVGLLASRPVADSSGFAAVEVLSQTGDLKEAAANFFGALRRLDALRLERIVAQPFPEQGLGRALNDRLNRASEHGE